MFEDLLHDWDGEEVALRYDEPTGAWMFLCVHSTVMGPGMGGTRMRTYANPHDALADGLRLSSAMTLKQAAADTPYGGGKAVLCVPSVPSPGTEERRTLLLRYGDMVDSLGGTYVTAADMNTGNEDMDVIGERTRHVLGRSKVNGGSGDPSEGTALGCFFGIKATVREAFGTADLAGKTVLIQGVGSVGARLAELLGEDGAELILADVNGDRVGALAERMGAAVIGVDEVITTDCDVLAPCATGSGLNADTIPMLACRTVAGCANNQLAGPDDAARLKDAGILYAPDFVINAGGVIHLAGYETLGWDEAKMRSRLEGIGDTLAEIFASAKTEGITTEEAAERLADARIEAARSAG
jgi:leucine dehydrogenase